MTDTRRVYVEANVSEQPGGQRMAELTFEVTRTIHNDEEPEQFGRTRDPNEDYDYSVELVSGDTDGNDLAMEEAEAEAIETAKREWRASAELPIEQRRGVLNDQTKLAICLRLREAQEQISRAYEAIAVEGDPRFLLQALRGADQYLGQAMGLTVPEVLAAGAMPFVGANVELGDDVAPGSEQDRAAQRVVGETEAA